MCLLQIHVTYRHIHSIFTQPFVSKHILYKAIAYVTKI